MTLHRAPSNISKVVKFVRIWGSYNITSGYWRWSPGPKDVSDVELWHGSPPYKFKYTNYQLHRIKTWIQHLQTYMQRKHEKATSAQGPSKRRAHIRQYIWFPSAPKARWSASCSCQSPQSGRQNFRPQRHPNTSRGTFGFCLERVPCVPTCMAEELAIKCPCGNQISKFIGKSRPWQACVSGPPGWTPNQASRLGYTHTTDGWADGWLYVMIFHDTNK